LAGPLQKRDMIVGRSKAEFQNIAPKDLVTALKSATQKQKTSRFINVKSKKE
jgi:hypothetical protein